MFRFIVRISIFVVLFTAFSVAALAQAGSLDPTFGSGGTVAYSNPLVQAGASDLEVQSDQKVVALTGPKGGPN